MGNIKYEYIPGMSNILSIQAWSWTARMCDYSSIFHRKASFIVEFIKHAESWHRHFRHPLYFKLTLFPFQWPWLVNSKKNLDHVLCLKWTNQPAVVLSVLCVAIFHIVSFFSFTFYISLSNVLKFKWLWLIVCVPQYMGAWRVIPNWYVNVYHCWEHCSDVMSPA